jgi:hypothetical protein
MATQTLPVAERLLHIRSRVGTTPGLLRLGMVATWVLSLLLFLLVWAGIERHQKALDTVGHDATASITAAQEMKARLADMDSEAANELLDKPDDTKHTADSYEKRRLQVTDNLIVAIRNITYPEEEPILKQLLNQLGAYEEAVGRARVLHLRGEGTAALEEYRRAHAIMAQPGDKISDTGLIAAADALDQVNDKQLVRRYTAEQLAAWSLLAVVVLPGLGLLGTLTALQLLLYRRMHRVFNPALLGATALAAGFLIYVVSSFAAVGRDLKRAKQDAFDSVGALWRARADAYDANGEESRWLLDPDRHEAYAKAFHEKVGRLVTLPPGMTYSQLVSAVYNLRLPAEAARLPQGFDGHLAKELRNITFPGEEEAAKDMLAKYGTYLAIDDKIRQLETEGKHPEAVRLCTGYREGESNWAFKQFDEALGKVLKINGDEFDRAIAAGKAALAGSEPAAAVVLLAVAVLTYVGLRPRLLEFAG